MSLLMDSGGRSTVQPGPVESELGELDAARKQKAVEELLKSRFFHKSPLLSAFLLYVSQRAIEEPSMRIPEYEIGVHVFGRGEDFDPREDNIVRNYARQLRKRLQEYYFSDGAADPVRVDIPRGGYVPLFTRGDVPSTPPSAWSGAGVETETVTKTARGHSRALRFVLVFVLLSLYSVALYRFARWRGEPHPHEREARDPLWSQMFNLNRDTYVVPPDTAFVVIQEANRKSLSLTEYLQWHAGAEMRNMELSYLQREAYTDLLSIFITTSLKDLKEVVPSRFIVRGADDMRFEDFRDSNAILIGSNFSNPWTELFSKNANFQFHCDMETDRSWIENVHPFSGERAVYEGGKRKDEYVTYATIVYSPNLGGEGHVLLLQGIDSAGTQAATDFLIRNENGKKILNQMMAANNGTLKNFELLLEVVSLDPGSHTTGIRVIGSRQYS